MHSCPGITRAERSQLAAYASFVPSQQSSLGEDERSCADSNQRNSLPRRQLNIFKGRVVTGDLFGEKATDNNYHVELIRFDEPYGRYDADTATGFDEVASAAYHYSRRERSN